MTDAEKKAYDKGWHQRNREVIKAFKKIQKKINRLVEKLEGGRKLKDKK